MTAAVFVSPVGYGRFCRWLTIGTSRHVTACLASIAADEPVLVTAARPADADLCSACREDLRVREARGEDLRPWRGELGVRAELAVEPTVRAAEELLGSAVAAQMSAPAVSRTSTPNLRRPAVELDLEQLFDDDRVSAFDHLPEDA